MQLIKLSANKDTFKTVKFEKNKLNIITWSKDSSSKDNLEKTFNWVWKSLLLNIVNFCLWSNKYNSFEEKLPWWEFTLEFELNGKTYVVNRATEAQSIIVVNWEEMGLKKYTELLGSEAFIIPEWIKGLSFRYLIKRFIRVEKESSQEWDKFKSESPYIKLLCNSFLLWLDVSMIQTKMDLKWKLDDIKASKDRLEKDEIFRKFFLWVENIDIQITDYEDSVWQLERAISQFKVAENYSKIEFDANKLKIRKSELLKDLFLIKNQIKSIDESLRLKINISLENVIHAYEEIQLNFPELIKKELGAVQDFHIQLLNKRQGRLLTSKQSLVNKLRLLEDELDKLDLGINSSLEFLWWHWALDEYDALNRKLSEERSSLNKLRDYKKVIARYKKEISSIKLELDTQNNLALNYLEDIDALLKKNNNQFRVLAKRFYPDSSSWIQIKENTGENTIQFDIDARIEYDSSDGIWEIKIFCFDLTLLLIQRNHNIEFIFHDSRILSDVDPRQIATLFQIIFELLEERKFQYIISINQNTLDSIKDIDAELFKKLNNSIILELKDESEQSKLLWINIDMDYEK